jgi:hypothetical protein
MRYCIITFSKRQKSQDGIVFRLCLPPLEEVALSVPKGMPLMRSRRILIKRGRRCLYCSTIEFFFTHNKTDLGSDGVYKSTPPIPSEPARHRSKWGITSNGILEQLPLSVLNLMVSTFGQSIDLFKYGFPGLGIHAEESMLSFRNQVFLSKTSLAVQIGVFLGSGLRSFVE